MSLEQALEHDISVFLDEEQRGQQKPELTHKDDMLPVRDYLQEIQGLLKRNKIEEAKAVFNELKTAVAAIPEEHPQEKASMIQLMQNAYITIYNFVNEQARTAQLLQRYAQTPDEVFDQAIKPIDLQKIQTAVPRVTEFEPLTIQTLQKRMQVEPQVANLVPMMQPQPAQAQPAQVLASPSAQALPPRAQMPAAAEPQVMQPSNIANIVATSLKRADALSVSAPERALSLLGQAALALQRLPQDVQAQLKTQFTSIETKAKEQSAVNNFKKYFNDEFVKVTSLGRLRSGGAAERYTSLLQEVETFEKEHPQAGNAFSAKLRQLRSTVQLFTEDEIAERVKDYVLRIKAAKPGSSEQRYAYQAYLRYIDSLPQGQYKDLLKEHLPKSARGSQSEEAFLKRVQPILSRINLMRRRGDKQGVLAALAELERSMNMLASSAEVKQLQQRIETLRQQTMGFAGEDEKLELAARPYVRRLKAARVARNRNEELLALQAFSSFVNSLPQSSARTTLEASIKELTH